MRIASRLGSVWLLGAGLIASCGARTGLFVGVGIGGEEPCTHPIALEKAVPNLYFVLDRSTSMRENNKWDTVRTVISDLMTSLGPDASYGAATFPAPASTNACAPGAEILPLTPGDTTGAAAAALLTATMIQPDGGTPTAATLTSLMPELTSFKGSTYAILATDGGANCNPSLSCVLDTCTANLDAVAHCQPFTPPNCCAPGGPAGPIDCLDTQDTVDAVTKLKQAGVPVYVVGILGSAPYESMLDQLAQAGGTARAAAPYYYRVDTADAQALAAALAQIAARITASCTVKLAGPPNDPATVVVSLGGKAVPQDATNGWQIEGTTLTLAGASCQELLTGQALGLAVSDGCSM